MSKQFDAWLKDQKNVIAQQAMRLYGDRNRHAPGKELLTYGAGVEAGFDAAVALLATRLAAIDDLMDQLCLSLPFVEDAENDPAFKKAAVRHRITVIKEVMARVDGTHPAVTLPAAASRL